MPHDWSKEFETLEEAIEALEALKGRLLFGPLPDEIAENPVAEQHLLAAHAALDAAKSHLRLAAIVFNSNAQKSENES